LNNSKNGYGIKSYNIQRKQSQSVNDATLCNKVYQLMLLEKKPILVEGLDPIYKLGHPIQE
jgi:hypothetical protein